MPACFANLRRFGELGILQPKEKAAFIRAHNRVKRRGTKHQNATGEVEFKKILFTKGSQEHKEHQRIASLARWAKPGAREHMHNVLLGNKNQSAKRIKP